MPRTLKDRRQNCAVNGESDLNAEMENIARETDVSLDEMMSLACRQGKLDIVELLLESGAHVDYRNKAGNTPLLEACSQGHKNVAEYLLDHDASIDAATDTTSDSALTWACTLGNESIVELLLSRKGDVEHRTKDGCTALMFAALAGHVKVATMLLDCKANINVESDSNKDSPLTFACWKGHVDVVELLLERSANIEHRTKEGFTPLMFSALGGHTDVAQELLKRQAKVNEPSGSNNDIPLTSACWKGHHEVVKLLLEYKSNIEHRTKDGCTPLMLAAREGHLIVAQLILDSGALVNVPSGSENNIPLTLACWKGHTDVVELLLNHNSDKEHRNKAGCTPLMLAAREGHLATTKLLLGLGAEVNTPSGSNDDTPLTLACWKGHHEVVDLLLDHESHVDHQTKTGCTPLMEATREGHEKVVSLLLENSADVELPDNYGQSPLFMACWKGHRDVAELLLRYNANRECRTKTGITPLFQACRENHVSVVELLLDQGASVSASFPNSRENPMTLAAEKGYVELMDVLLSRGGNVDCRTKKGCSPFFLACKEGHLEIARSLYENSADIEVCDQRNISPLVAAFKNGHQKVVEWILSIAKHVPSDEQCQKCITAPWEEKDNERDLLYLRTMCYEMIKKAKKVKEQAALENAQSFLQELEEDKVREENKKKKQAAKRRDKRKKKKKQKECEQQSIVNNEPQPSENRTTIEEVVMCSKEEALGIVLSDNDRAQPRHEDWSYESEIKNRKNLNTCRTMTVGQAQNEKGNTNSTEERRDDQPQAMFDASDQQDHHSSPKKREPREKTNHEIENNLKNKPQSKRTSANRAQDLHLEIRSNAPVSGVISEQRYVVENGFNDEQFEPHVKDKVKTKDEIVSSTEFVPRGNVVKSSGHTDTIVKDGWKPTAQRAKQVSSDYFHCWKEVTRNSSSKTMVIQLTAPNALCGRVIGRGGTKINGITEESGAQITIGKPDPKNPNDRVITIKGAVKCVQKAKQLVSNALNSPSSLTQTQTPNLASYPVSSNVHSQSISGVAPIRGNFVAITRSSAEWPTVVQAHSGSTKVQEPLNKTTEGKTVSMSDQSTENMSRETRETRAHSAPDLQCSTEANRNQAGTDVWSVDINTGNPSVSSSPTSTTGTPVVPAAVYNPTTVSTATKARTKSYATTQDGSRLSYCEVAIGIESGSSKNENDCQVSNEASSSATSWKRVSTEETDNVFTDDGNFEETGTNIEPANAAVKDQFVVSNPWKEDVTDVDNGIQCSPPSSANDSPQTRRSMNMLPQSSSLFSGSTWSSRENKEFDKVRSVSWSGQDLGEPENHGTQNDLQSSQPDISALPSHSIWSPVQPGGMAVEAETVESTGWDNSNSASSSRSSSRLELSSIMENERNIAASSFQQTTPPDVLNTCDVNELSDEYPGSWISSRGAHSAPSSPSLVRSRDQRMKFPRPVTAQSNSYDDMSDRLWSSRRTSDDPSSFDSAWNTNITQAQSSSSIYSERVSHRNTSSPKLGSFKQYRDTSCSNTWGDPILETSPFAHDVMRLLEQLSLTKYKQTFEENYITMDKLVNMTDTDLQKIGVPKGPRLKIMHAVQRNNGITNGPISHKTMNERVSSSVAQPDMLGHVPGSGTLLNHMQMDQNVRVPTHAPFTQVMAPNTQVLQKQNADAGLNPVLLPYLNNTHHSLLSLDPSLAGPSAHPHLEQHMNGLHSQQQFIIPSVPSDQYDPQSSYMTSGVPYQQQIYYPRPPGAYYYYP